MRALLIASMLALSAPSVTIAQSADPIVAEAATPELEERARALGRTLRCVVCQNQSIEESDADLAADMRVLVREELSAGKTEAEVTALMRDRYGDYVLLKPPVQGNTIVLWFAPLIAALGGLFWFISLRRRREVEPLEALSDEDRARLEALRR